MRGSWLVLGLVVPVVGCGFITGADDLVVAEDALEPASSSKDNTNKPKTSPSKGTSTSTTTTTTTQAPAPSTTNAGPAMPKLPPPFTPSVPTHPLTCDGYECSGSTPHCCQSDSARGRCVALAEDCATIRVTCDATSCLDGAVCCAFPGAQLAACTTPEACAAMPKAQVVCNSDNQCNGGKCNATGDVFDLTMCSAAN